MLYLSYSVLFLYPSHQSVIVNVVIVDRVVHVDVSSADRYPLEVISTGGKITYDIQTCIGGSVNPAWGWHLTVNIFTQCIGQYVCFNDYIIQYVYKSLVELSP